MNKIILYCRIGFEKEAAAEITEKSTALGIFGYAKVIDHSGYIIFECYQAGEADDLAKLLKFEQLIFARQMIVVSDLLDNLSVEDRITPILAEYNNIKNLVDFTKSTDIWVETSDTNESKELLTFCRKFTVPLRQKLKQQGYLNFRGNTLKGLTLHIFFIRPNCCYVGYSYNNNHSSYFMGIPRLKFPIDAPSRSTLKLEEAILTFISKQEEIKYFNENIYAVDLGACPGGWTYQLVKRNVFVYAVDHGKMATSLHDTGRIEHCPEDGFKFEPPKRKKIDWLVCDMVEKPSRIAALISKWIVKGWCQKTIFNLKLPMKKRYLEVQQCLQKIETDLEQQGIDFDIKAKHLYHDREEITVYIRVK